MIADTQSFMTQWREMRHMSSMFKFDFSIQATYPFKMLQFVPNSITNRTSGCRDMNSYLNLLNNYKQEFVSSFSPKLKIKISNIQLIFFDQVT